MSRLLTVPPVRAAANRILGVIISILFGTVCATIRAQSLPVNPYQHLDDAARVAHDAPTVGLLIDDIYGTALFGRLSPRLTERIVRAELSFQGGAHPAITEKALADAVNALGTQLGTGRYTGTNALQIRLLRVDFMAELPHLIRSYAPRADKSLVGSDMSPCGAVWVGFLILRQKLTNPAWYGDPDQQNKTWLAASRPTQSSTSSYRSSTGPEPPEVTALANALTNGLAMEGSPVTSAFHNFLDIAGFEK